MSNVVFTIVAKNYIGLGHALAASVHEFNPEVSFYIIIADELDAPLTSTVANVTYVVAKDVLSIAPEKWTEMSFKYDLTEFCTAIKPGSFLHLMNLHPGEKIIYFDPDIEVFSSLAPIFNDLENNFLVVTPHLTTPENDFTGDVPDTDFLGAGMYNLGFLGLRNCAEAEQAMEWWHHRLLDYCFIDRSNSLFTDQKWMNYVTCFFDNGVKVSRNLGMNIAPWNYYERRISVDNGIFYVESRIHGDRKTPLVFSHFSGVNYQNVSMANNKNVPLLKLDVYTDLPLMFDAYKTRLNNANATAFFHLKYSYNAFSNGVSIISAHRRLFRRLADMEQVTDPFDANGKFYNGLQKQNLIIESSNIAVDKQNDATVKDFSGKIKMINRAMLILKSVIGFQRYLLLSKLFVRYFKPENQLFLYDRKFLSSSFRKN